jgi:excinuclease ABC subunit A
MEGNYEMQFCDSIENCHDFKEVIVVDQTAIGRTTRSVPATYMGIMDRIRKLFAETDTAKQNKMDANSFSFNNKEGQCENCHGDGQIVPKFSEDIWVTCPVCYGKRYKKAILEIKYHNKSISDVLEMSVEQAISFFEDIEEIRSVLTTLEEVGLGYLKLGQNSTTLSGGEASRLKLAKELASKNVGNTLYLIDEPTTGLHFSDIANLICLFQKLVEEGNTVVIIEHNKHMIDNCDWIIELGPKAGKEGGYVIREGKA